MMYRRTLTCLVLCLLLFGATGALGQDVPDADDDRPEGFGGCSVGTARGHCGTVSVPENRDFQDGRRLDLFVAVAPARTDNRRPEPIVVLEGG
ncbi:MAG: hypothetical protein GWO04_03835, partial [Actinobacteria bacterium]|nr:hypothetical protein [Actinomycetota bacterium]NIV85776.1 hypothetical protein [Actinomycetota bacterium]